MVKCLLQLIVLICVFIALSSHHVFAIEFEGNIPEEAAPVVKLLKATAEGKVLSEADTLFDFESMVKRIFGDGYESLSQDEKAYLAQLISFYIKGTYRQIWMVNSTKESKLSGFLVEKSGDDYIVSLKSEFLSDKNDVVVIVNGKGNDGKICDLGLGNKFISDLFKDAYRQYLTNAPKNISDYVKHAPKIDFFEMFVIEILHNTATTSMEFNQMWYDKSKKSNK